LALGAGPYPAAAIRRRRRPAQPASITPASAVPGSGTAGGASWRSWKSFRRVAPELPANAIDWMPLASATKVPIASWPSRQHHPGQRRAGLGAQAGVKLRHAGGIEVEHIKENGVTFYGSDGEIYVNRGKFKMTVKGVEKGKAIEKTDQPGLNPTLDAVEKEFLADAKVKLYASTDHKADFLASIASRKPPICDVEVGARTVTACHLTSLAYWHGQKMQWNPATNQFTGGTGDAAWLTRDYRGAWKV